MGEPDPANARLFYFFVLFSETSAPLIVYSKGRWEPNPANARLFYFSVLFCETSVPLIVYSKGRGEPEPANARLFYCSVLFRETSAPLIVYSKAISNFKKSVNEGKNNNKYKCRSDTFNTK